MAFEWPRETRGGEGSPPRVVIGTIFTGRDLSEWKEGMKKLKRKESSLKAIWLDVTGEESRRRYDYLKKEMPFEVEVIGHPLPIVKGKGGVPYTTGRDRVLHQRKGVSIAQAYNLIRDRFLDTGGDYLWIVEDDVIPPPDALPKLLSCFKEEDVGAAAGVVRVNYPEEGVVMAWDLTSVSGGFQTVPKTEVGGEKPVEVGGASFGCIMIPARVVSAVRFRTGLGYTHHQDITFSADLRRLGGRMLLDPRVECEHVPES